MALFAQLRVKGLQSNCLRLCAVRREIEVAPPGSCTRCWVGVLCKYSGKTKSRHRMTGLFTTGCPRSALSSPQTDSSWTPLLISSPGGWVIVVHPPTFKGPQAPLQNDPDVSEALCGSGALTLVVERPCVDDQSTSPKET